MYTDITFSTSYIILAKKKSSVIGAEDVQTVWLFYKVRLPANKVIVQNIKFNQKFIISGNKKWKYRVYLPRDRLKSNYFPCFVKFFNFDLSAGKLTLSTSQSLAAKQCEHF